MGDRPTIQSLHKQITILGNLQRPNRRTQNLHPQPLQNTHLVQLDTNIQRALTSKRQEDTVRAFLLEHIGNIVGGNGKEVDLVRKVV